MPISRTWPQVYPNKDHTDPDTWNKVGSYVPRKDWQLINSVIGQSGGISHIIDHAIKHTADTIRTHNLSYIDSERFVKWLCQRSFSEFATTAQGPTGHDGRGKESSGDAVARVADVTTGVGSGVATEGGGDGRSGGSVPVVPQRKRNPSRLDKIKEAVRKNNDKGDQHG